MKPNAASMNALWAGMLMKELVRLNVRTVVISPGSRSTPLALAAADHGRIETVVHFDERGAAFYALGVARATNQPVALICTSGTAGANYYPAVIEADLEEIPLIVLTADRPAHLRDSGANQTIRQVGMFRSYVEAEIDLPVPSDAHSPQWLLSTIDAVVTETAYGPVHINCQFDEPLAPLGGAHDFSDYLAPVADWLHHDVSYKQTARTAATLDPSLVNELAAFLADQSSGVIVAGRMRSTDATAVAALGERLGWPILPDIRSGMRLGRQTEAVASYYDLLLAANPDVQAPEVVLHFGGNLTSKRLSQWLDRHRLETYIHVTPFHRPYDPNHRVTTLLRSDITQFCEGVRHQVSQHSTNLPDSVHFADVSSLTIDETIDRVLESDDFLTEPMLARLISREIISESALWLASSLPIREFDMFAATNGPQVEIASNRGASGIDGTVASAVGWANGLQRQTTLVIGDLALLHDLNSLDLLRRSKVPLIVIVFNNDGGGIFSMLPVAKVGEQFTSYFLTPHGLSFEAAARQFELGYSHPQTTAEFVEHYRKAQRSGRSGIIEVTTDRDATMNQLKTIVDSIRQSMHTL